MPPALALHPNGGPQAAWAAATFEARGFKLAPFQRDGIVWLTERGDGLLSDMPGLGKTCQALGTIPQNGAAMVVCPAVVKAVWAAECARLRPDLARVVLSGKGSFRWPTPGELVILNWDLLTLAEAESNPPRGVTLILDELHVARNPATVRSRAVLGMGRNVRGRNGHTIGLTGTPLVNRPLELWHVLNVLGVAVPAFGNRVKFLELFELIARDRVWAVSAHVCNQLRRVMLLRTKADALSLPPKRVQDIPVQVEYPLAEALNTMAAEAGVDLGQHLTDEGLYALLHHPEHFRVRRAIALACVPALMDLIPEYESAEEPVVVFSAHLAPVQLAGVRPGWGCISGDVPMQKRTATVAAFQAGELKGLAATIQSAGTGITLTRAAHAVFVDLAWTPAENEQAQDRIHRHGSARPVLIRRLVLDHPLVHRVHELLDQKQALVDLAVMAASTPARRAKDSAVTPATDDVVMP